MGLDYPAVLGCGRVTCFQDPKSGNWIKVTHTADGAMSVTHTYSEAAVSGSEFPGKPLIF